MPRIEKEMRFARPMADVFAFFCETANLVRTLPPELNLQLVAAPDRLHLGALLTLQGRRWGVRQTVRSEITAFEPFTLFIDEQREGPFGKWIHRHRFEAANGGTRMVDQIEFEPPGGLLGLLVTADFVLKDLEWILGYRAQKLRELLGD
jgi:ligand-binding SRPBCC domain-containing protein